MAPQKDANSGQVVNFISSDAFFLADSFSLFIVGITAPIQIIGKLYNYISTSKVPY
jgi:hypothetical protein